MDIYIVGFISMVSVVLLAMLFSRYKKITFKEYTKKYDDL